VKCKQTDALYPIASSSTTAANAQHKILSDHIIYAPVCFNLAA
jgi:hypothetical protein